jgi:hypothetical protein
MFRIKKTFQVGLVTVFANESYDRNAPEPGQVRDKEHVAVYAASKKQALIAN